MHKDHILCIGDTHFPFEHKDYLDFVLQIKDRVKCGTVVHIGDLVDNHSLSYHEHNPNGRSPLDEINEARQKVKKWAKAIPKMLICRGNHDCLIERKARTNGMPEIAFKPFREIWDLPLLWKDEWEHNLYGVKFIHGTGYSGDNAHLKASYDNRQSVVIGHTHSFGGVGYMANNRDCVFGLNVGCGIDRHKYAFTYGKDFKKKPILGCGVITDNGKFAQVFPMPL